MPRSRFSVSFTLLTVLGLWASRTVLAAPGPGIGNVECTQSEAFKPLAFVENTQGGPTGANVVILTGGYLMLIYANDSGGPPGILAFYDVSNPRQPRSVRRIDNADTRQFREAHSFPVAVIGDKHYVAIQTIRGIQFWDVTDAMTASKIGNIDLPGVNAGDYENVSWQASWQGRYLFVSGGNLGVFVIDAANPTQPKLLKTVPTGSAGGFRIGPLYALGDYLVYSNMDQGGSLGILDISKAESPALLTTKKNLPRMYSFLVSGDRIYGAGRDGDFTIHSWADPTLITEVKIARIGQDSLYVAAQDHFAYSGRQENFVKIDLKDEKNPKVIGEATLGRTHQDHGQVTPIGNLIFIGNDHGTGSAFFCHQTGKDTIPPTILKTFPTDGATYVPTTSRLTLSWSDYIDMRTVGPDTITIRTAGGAQVTGMYTYTFNTLSFGPDQPWAANTTYEMVVRAGGVKDAMGNAFATERTVRFSTGASVAVPVGGTGGAGAGGAPAAGGSVTSGGAIGAGGSMAGTGGNRGTGGSGGGSQQGGAAGRSDGGWADVGSIGTGGSQSQGGSAGTGTGGSAGALSSGGSPQRGGSTGTGSGGAGSGGSSGSGGSPLQTGGIVAAGSGGTIALTGGSGSGGRPVGGSSASSGSSGSGCRVSPNGASGGAWILPVLFALGVVLRPRRRR